MEAAGNTIISVQNACSLGKEKILSSNKSGRNLSYLAKEGESRVKISLDKAVDTAARMILEAEKPLFYGWSNTCCEAQKIGLNIARTVRGVWDNTTSVCHGTASIAMAEAGIPSATLGEIKNRADLIIYWGSNPVEAHPRHLKRYSYYSKGRFISEAAPRKMVVIDVRRTKTAKMADKYIQVKPNSDYQLITALQHIIKYGEVKAEGLQDSDLHELYQLSELMRQSRFGVIFFGLGLTMTGYGFCNVDAIYSLARELNRKGKWVAIPMRGHYNVTGANIVSTYTAGFPFAVDFSGGKPYYNPGETTAIDLIQNGDCDLLMSVAADPLGMFPRETALKAGKLKIIAADPFKTPTTEAADLVLPTLICGVESSGTAYRMDGVPIPLKSIIKPDNNLLSDEQLLKRIYDKLSVK